MSQSSNPPVTILWREAGILISPHYITTTSFDGNHHGTKVLSSVIIPADKPRCGSVITCTPVLEGHFLEGLAKDFPLNITCKYSITFTENQTKRVFIYFVVGGT